MYSQRLRVTGNLSDGDRDHGLRSTTRTSRDPRNHVRGRRRRPTAGRGDAEDREHGALAVAEDGGARPGKCVFIYNSNRNRFVGNRFEAAASGCTSPPDRRATPSPATPSSPIARR